MKYLSIFTLLLSFFVSTNSYAQFDGEAEGVTSFQKDRDSWRRREDIVEILQVIQDSVGNAGMKNIKEAEQVYCYVVEAAPANYEGYTVNNMAVKSFCGSLDRELRSMLVSSLFVDEERVSSSIEQCVIRPKVMFRFMRGIDYTDVLLSSPCYSMTFFYGGKLKTYNLSKASGIVDEIINVFSNEENVIPFISPALLDQVIPVGIVQTDEQRNRIKQSKPSNVGPVKKWEEEKPVEEPVKKQGGWNNLSM